MERTAGSEILGLRVDEQYRYLRDVVGDPDTLARLIREETEADMAFAARFIAKAEAIGKPDLPRGESPQKNFLREVARKDYR
jgi:hypothetical protein